jgi:hypothetical protein
MKLEYYGGRYPTIDASKYPVVREWIINHPTASHTSVAAQFHVGHNAVGSIKSKLTSEGLIPLRTRVPRGKALNHTDGCLKLDGETRVLWKAVVRVVSEWDTHLRLCTNMAVWDSIPYQQPAGALEPYIKERLNGYPSLPIKSLTQITRILNCKKDESCKRQ